MYRFTTPYHRNINVEGSHANATVPIPPYVHYEDKAIKKPHPNKNRKKCVICNRRRTDGTFHAQIPNNDEKRCYTWIKLIGIQDLVYIPIEKLHLKRVCGRHFEDRCFKFRKTLSKLLPTAIPTLELPNPPLTDEQMKEFPLRLKKRVIRHPVLEIDHTYSVPMGTPKKRFIHIEDDSSTTQFVETTVTIETSDNNLTKDNNSVLDTGQFPRLEDHRYFGIFNRDHQNNGILKETNKVEAINIEQTLITKDREQTPWSQYIPNKVRKQRKRKTKKEEVKQNQNHVKTNNSLDDILEPQDNLTQKYEHPVIKNIVPNKIYKMATVEGEVKLAEQSMLITGKENNGDLNNSSDGIQNSEGVSTQKQFVYDNIVPNKTYRIITVDGQVELIEHNIDENNDRNNMNNQHKQKTLKIVGKDEVNEYNDDDDILPDDISKTADCQLIHDTAVTSDAPMSNPVPYMFDNMVPNKIYKIVTVDGEVKLAEHNTYDSILTSDKSDNVSMKNNNAIREDIDDNEKNDIVLGGQINFIKYKNYNSSQSINDGENTGLENSTTDKNNEEASNMDLDDSDYDCEDASKPLALIPLEKYKNVKKKLKELQTREVSLKESVMNLKQEISNLSDEKSALKSEVCRLKSERTLLREKVAEFETARKIEESKHLIDSLPEVKEALRLCDEQQQMIIDATKKKNLRKLKSKRNLKSIKGTELEAVRRLEENNHITASSPVVSEISQFCDKPRDKDIKANAEPGVQENNNIIFPSRNEYITLPNKMEILSRILPGNVVSVLEVEKIVVELLELRDFKQKLSKCYSTAQIDVMVNGPFTRNEKWGESDLKAAAYLKQLTNWGVYNYLRDQMRMPLPYPKILDNFIKSSEDKSGIEDIHTELNELRKWKKKLTAHYSSAQLEIMMNRRLSRKEKWSEKDLKAAAYLRHIISRKAFYFLRDQMLIPLPNPKLIDRFIREKTNLNSNVGTEIEETKNVGNNVEFENVNVETALTKEHTNGNTEIEQAVENITDNAQTQDLTPENDIYLDNTLEAPYDTNGLFAVSADRNKPLEDDIRPNISDQDNVIYGNSIAANHGDIHDQNISYEYDIPNVNNTLDNIMPNDNNMPLIQDKNNSYGNVSVQEHTSRRKRKKIFKSQDLICQLCMEPFNTREEVREHVAEHYYNTVCTYYLDARWNPKTKYHCDFCGEAVHRKVELLHHHRMHLDINALKCYYPGCNYVGKNRDCLAHHRVSHRERVLQCEQCPATFARPASLREHVARRHSAGGPRRCALCLAPYSNAYTYRRHMRSHSRPPRYKCTEENCAEAFYSKTARGRHKLAVHMNGGFKCPWCPLAVYGHISHYEKHMKLHETKKIVNCLKCREIFYSYGAFYTHSVTAHPPPTTFKYTCACSKRYNVLKYFEIHKTKCHIALAANEDPNNGNNENAAAQNTAIQSNNSSQIEQANEDPNNGNNENAAAQNTAIQSNNSSQIEQANEDPNNGNNENAAAHNTAIQINNSSQIEQANEDPNNGNNENAAAQNTAIRSNNSLQTDKNIHKKSHKRKNKEQGDNGMTVSDENHKPKRRKKKATDQNATSLQLSTASKELTQSNYTTEEGNHSETVKLKENLHKNSTLSIGLHHNVHNKRHIQNSVAQSDMPLIDDNYNATVSDQSVQNVEQCVEQNEQVVDQGQQYYEQEMKYLEENVQDVEQIAQDAEEVYYYVDEGEENIYNAPEDVQQNVQQMQQELPGNVTQIQLATPHGLQTEQLLVLSDDSPSVVATGSSVNIVRTIRLVPRHLYDKFKSK